MTTLQEIETIQAEVYYYHDSVALLRARLYRRGLGVTPRLDELQRHLEDAELRLQVARSKPPRRP